MSKIASSIYARLDKANAAVELRTTNLDEQIDRGWSATRLKFPLLIP